MLAHTCLLRSNQKFFKIVRKRRRSKKIGFKIAGLSRLLSSVSHRRLGSSLRADYMVEFLKRNFSRMTLRAEKRQAIKHLIYLKTYRGWRHERRLPVRGQSARTNAKTRRKRGVQ